MFYQIFLSPQVKRCAIITYEYGIYKLPNELLNDLGLGKLENIRKVSKTPQNDTPMRSPPAKIKILSILRKNSWKIEIKLFP